MPIYELQPRVKVGLFRVGSKEGRVVDEGEVIFSERFDHSRFKRFLHTMRIWRRSSIERWIDSVIVSGNSLRVYEGRDDFKRQCGITEQVFNLTA